VPVEGRLPDVAGLAFRPRAITLGQGQLRGTVRGTAFAGGTREYVLETTFGVVKAEADAALPAYHLGQEVMFDLPIERAAVLART